MIIKVSQQKFKWDFKYNISVDHSSSFLAKANRTILPTKRRVFIMDEDGNVLIELLEKNMLRKFLWSLPFVGIIAAFFYKELYTYDIIQNNNLIGSISRIRDYSQPRVEGHINERSLAIYEFSLGRKGIKYPVFYNGVQVGLIEKSLVTNYNADTYVSHFDSDSDMICNILTNVVVDLVFQTSDISTEISSKKIQYEWNLLQGLAKVQYDENWKPK
jgi:hypothetical protein